MGRRGKGGKGGKGLESSIRVRDFVVILMCDFCFLWVMSALAFNFFPMRSRGSCFTLEVWGSGRVGWMLRVCSQPSACSQPCKALTGVEARGAVSKACLCDQYSVDYNGVCRGGPTLVAAILILSVDLCPLSTLRATILFLLSTLQTPKLSVLWCIHSFMVCYLHGYTCHDYDA